MRRLRDRHVIDIFDTIGFKSNHVRYRSEYPQYPRWVPGQIFLEKQPGTVNSYDWSALYK